MNQDGDVSRREFLARAMKAGGALAVAGGTAALFHRGRNYATDDDRVEPWRVPDFSTGRQAMAIVHGSDRRRTVRRALDAVGGMDLYVRPGDIVLLKVNAAFALPAALCATTHPDLVDEVVRLCLAAGAAEVRVTDNPINDPASCFRLTGIGAAAEAAGARLIQPRPGSFHAATLAGGKLIKDWPVLREPLTGATKLIGLAPLKDHHRSGASMTMKNWYGLLGGRRNVFHQDIHTIIKELAMLVKPTLVILDGTAAMMTNGPTGGSFDDLKATNTLIVSTDQVAADAFGATLLGRSAADLPYIGRAAAAAVGTLDYRALNPVVTEVAPS